MKPNNRTRVTRVLSLFILLPPHQASTSFSTADTMAPAKFFASSSVLVLSLLGQSVDGFLGPLPLASERIAAARRAAVAPRSLSNRLESHPQHTREAWRRQASMMTVQRDERPPPFGKDGKELVHKEPRWRLSNISRRVRKMIRKAIMGYLPEEEISYKESVAMAAAASEALRRETQIVDEGLVDDSIKAKNAARGLVEARQGDDDDILGDDFVHLDVGDRSPMEAEETMAAIKKRLEKGIPPDTDAERLFRQQQQQQQQQQRRERSSRPPSFDGDTAVAELPSPKAGMDQPKEGTTGSRALPTLASREDIERLERLFHSAGGEPLR